MGLVFAARLAREAEDWALHAYLRSCPDSYLPGDVGEALLWCMFCLWAIENLEEE